MLNRVVRIIKLTSIIKEISDATEYIGKKGKEKRWVSVPLSWSRSSWGKWPIPFRRCWEKIKFRRLMSYNWHTKHDISKCHDVRSTTAPFSSLSSVHQYPDPIRIGHDFNQKLKQIRISGCNTFMLLSLIIAVKIQDRSILKSEIKIGTGGPPEPSGVDTIIDTQYTTYQEPLWFSVITV